MKCRRTSIVAISLVLLFACLSPATAQFRPAGDSQRPGGRFPGGRGGGGRGFMNPYPLHSAAEHGDIAMMERMLGRGMMTLDEPDGEGKTALQAAALAGQTNSVAW